MSILALNSHSKRHITMQSTASSSTGGANPFVSTINDPSLTGFWKVIQQGSNATAQVINTVAQVPINIRGQSNNWFSDALASVLEYIGIPSESKKDFARVQSVVSTLKADAEGRILLETNQHLQPQEIEALGNYEISQEAFKHAIRELNIDNEKLGIWDLIKNKKKIQDKMENWINSNEEISPEAKVKGVSCAKGLLNAQLGGVTQLANFFLFPSIVGPQLYQAAGNQLKSGNTGFAQLLGGLAMTAFSAQSLQIARDVYHMDFGHLPGKAKLVAPFALAAVSLSHVLGSGIRIEQTVYDIGHAKSDDEPNALQKGINFFGKVFDFLNVSSIICFFLHDFSRLQEIKGRANNTNAYKAEKNILLFRTVANGIAAAFGTVANIFEPIVDSAEEKKTQELKFMFKLAKTAMENQPLDPHDLEKLKKASPEFKTNFKKLLQILVARQQMEEELITPIKALKAELDKKLAAGKISQKEAESILKEALQGAEQQMQQVEMAIDKFIKGYMGNIPFQKWMIRLVKEVSFWPLIVAMVGSRSLEAFQHGGRRMDENPTQYKGRFGLLKASYDSVRKGDVTRNLLGIGAGKEGWMQNIMKAWTFTEIPIVLALLAGQGLQIASVEGSPIKETVSGLNEALNKNPAYGGFKLLTDIMMAS